MLAAELSNLLAPFAALLNNTAISANYRSLAITPTGIRGCSAFGAMEARFATGIEEEVFVDGAAFIQVVRSVAPSKPFQMLHEAGSIEWFSGSDDDNKRQAHGRLGTTSAAIPPPNLPDDAALQEVSIDFGRALDLGGLACSSQALMSVGLYGIVIDNAQAGARALSSDNDRLASASMGHHLPGPELVTLSPAGANLLSVLTQRGKARVAFVDRLVYCTAGDPAGNHLRAVIECVSPLKYDIRATSGNFKLAEISQPLDREVVSSFIRRVEAMAENKREAKLTLSVATDGSVCLAFQDGKSSSEEYYLAQTDAKRGVEVAPIEVDSRRIAKVLTHASTISFDYVAQGAIVLRGPLDFLFVVSGKVVGGQSAAAA